MQSKYIPPSYKGDAFHCPICSVYSNQQWYNMYYGGNTRHDRNLVEAICTHCGNSHYWSVDLEVLVFPRKIVAESPHPDIPDDCLADFEEARAVLEVSPKAAAALTRLALQKLMVHLGEAGKNINDDIKHLVEKGLPIEIQQALDFCRVVGNNAVHPGEINVDDNPEIVSAMFDLINFIVEDRIARPKRISELYGKLPVTAKEAIKKRDAS